MKNSTNKSVWIPLSLLIFFIAVLLLMAFTDLFIPLISFVHFQEITAFQALLCIIGSVLGFFLVFKILVKLGEFFLADKD